MRDVNKNDEKPILKFSNHPSPDRNEKQNSGTTIGFAVLQMRPTEAAAKPGKPVVPLSFCNEEPEQLQKICLFQSSQFVIQRLAWSHCGIGQFKVGLVIAADFLFAALRCDKFCIDFSFVLR